MGEYSVRADVEHQRVYLRLAGLLSDDEMMRAADEFIAALRDMKSGFAVINDISECKPLTQKSTLEVKRASEAAVERGMGISMRVVGPSVTATMQFNRNANSVGYQTGTAKSVAEAEKMIDDARKR
ncbi:MAG: hypothetical protein U0228_24970 [Myxococcaceae bacterium]